ncbi:MAG: DUF3843 family protein [Bacteroidia bacterium]|nr:DUF3843 family protein [Bacteroidia bacterium]
MMYDYKKVYLPLWMQFHPYRQPSQSDYYCIELCYEVHKIFLLPAHKEIRSQLTDDQLNNMCCSLVGYFEDVISGIGLWQAFTRQHKKLYGRYLPFYHIMEYYPDEINPEDIYFLILYNFSNIYYKQKIFLPTYDDIIRLGLDVYQLLDEKYEYAPENIKLKEFITIPKQENDYYKIRTKIEWIALNSYLFYTNRIECVKEISESLKSKDDNFYSDNSSLYAHEIKDSFIISKTTPLLALKGKDWLANILGEEHALYEDLLNITEKKTGMYLYLKQDDNYLYFQHIASDTIVPVIKRSIEKRRELKEGESILFISFVKWKNEWWFSGIYALFPYNAKFISEEKNSIQNRALFTNNIERHLEFLQQQYELFLRFNNNKPIAFFKNSTELEKFVNGYYDFYQQSLKLSEKEIEEAIERARQKGLTEKKTGIKLDYHDVPCLVFFNKLSGIELGIGIAKYIPDKNNPYYDKNLEAWKIIHILVSKDFSKEFFMYLVNNYEIKGIQFQGETDNKIMLNNLDFMLRYWKRGNYFSKPQIVLT